MATWLTPPWCPAPVAEPKNTLVPRVYPFEE